MAPPRLPPPGRSPASDHHAYGASVDSCHDPERFCLTVRLAWLSP